MAKKRNLGHISPHHAMKRALAKFIDDNDITGSAASVTAVWEKRLDYVEDSIPFLNTRITNVSSSINSKITNVSSSVDSNKSDIEILNIGVENIDGDIIKLQTDINEQYGNISVLGSDISDIKIDVSSVGNDVSSLSSSVALDFSTVNSDIINVNSDIILLSSSVASDLNIINSDITYANNEILILSSSLESLTQSFLLLSASVGEGGGLSVNVDDDAELYFNGDTLMTNADVYISGSGNNLYLQGTNEFGNPAKFEFSIVNGGTIIKEVPHTDFGQEVEDPWFKFDGDTLLTHADIYVSGSGNYLYLNGTNRQGEYAKFYFDIVDGAVIIKEYEPS